MALVFSLVYLAGVLATVVVSRARAGVTQLGRLSAATVALSLPWFLSQIVAMFVWPVALTIWLIRGRPESPWQSTVNHNGTLRVVRVR